MRIPAGAEGTPGVENSSAVKSLSNKVVFPSQAISCFLELHLFLKNSKKADEKLARTALGMWLANLRARGY